MSNDPQAFDVDRALAELEALVASIEQGQLPLEEVLARWERGAALARACNQALEHAEQKIQQLESLAPDAPLGNGPELEEGGNA